MILTKEGENNQLQERINSLKEDVDTVSPLFLYFPAVFPDRQPFVFTDLPVRSRFVAVCRRATVFT